MDYFYILELGWVKADDIGVLGFMVSLGWILIEGLERVGMGRVMNESVGHGRGSGLVWGEWEEGDVGGGFELCCSFYEVGLTDS